MLAASHAIGRNAVIDEEVAIFLAGILLERYPALLKARYGFSLDGLDAPGVLEAVAKKRGCILKGRGGELDQEKAAMVLLTDYRSGTLGRISLETPATRQAMLAAAASKAKSNGQSCRQGPRHRSVIRRQPAGPHHQPGYGLLFPCTADTGKAAPLFQRSSASRLPAPVITNHSFALRFSRPADRLTRSDGGFGAAWTASTSGLPGAPPQSRPGNRLAVWPSSPMPSSTTSKSATSFSQPA
jgi:hypothetical protein